MTALGSVPAQSDPLQTRPHYDIILRGGTVIDGTGADRYVADVGVDDGLIARIGDLSRATSDTEIDAEGLVVAPGFIDLHSHASETALPLAESSLRQGVTTELLNPDGGGILRTAERLSALEIGGLGINVGAYIGFNSVWSNVVGSDDRRATAAEIAKMQTLVRRGMLNGAWGVSMGLDYVPANFAQTDQVIDIVSAARDWRTNTGSHIRNEDVDVIESVAEHLTIGEKAGLVPVITHHKVMQCCLGESRKTLQLLDEANERGIYAAMDQYPYIAAQTGLSWIVPRWVLDGGRSEYLRRFSDPELRPQIVGEIEHILETKVGEAKNIAINSLGRTLADIAEERDVSPGEATIQVMEERGNLMSVWTFGNEDDVERIMRHPLVAVASDGGASTATTGHPRKYGTYARVLGQYVRERQVISLEDAVRKMTGLPATIVGMVDRGYLAEGMVADIAVFDPETVIDRATFEEPKQLAEGVKHVIVNGVLALTDGEQTGAHAGKALYRDANMISRPETKAEGVQASVNGRLRPLATPTLTGRTFTADFSGDGAGQPPAGWTETWRTGAWTVQEGPRRLHMGVSPGRRALTWDAVGVVTGDVELYGRVRGNGSSTVFQLGLGISGEAGKENAYLLRAQRHDHSNANQLQIARYGGGGVYNLDSETMPFSLDSDTWYRVLFQQEGEMLRGKVWPDGAQEPAEWQVEVADTVPNHSDVLASGRVGPAPCCSTGTNDWSFLSAGTDGRRAPRLPSDPPTVTDAIQNAQISFHAREQRGELTGQLVVNDAGNQLKFRSQELGKLQTAGGWATITGRGEIGNSGEERSFTLIMDETDPFADGDTVITVRITGLNEIKGRLQGHFLVE